ncbi:MAG: ABC transporter permease [Bacillota bacterium]|nr:ABC transporter permease [Bacillota bacterium]
MKTALIRALNLIISGNEELLNILATTAKMALSSSFIALIIGVPLGILLGCGRFRGRESLIVINRTLMGMPPVVCGLIFYMLFSGVGPFRHLQWMFTVKLMILAQVVLITPLVAGNLESHLAKIASPVKETAKGLGLGKSKTLLLIVNESLYQIVFTYLLAFARAIAEVGAISMVGGAIAWKTNVMTTAIMMYTNRGDFTLGVALGIILIFLSLLVNTALSILQRRLAE